jgi:hypothetical protein
VDITNQVKTAISNVSLNAGIFQMDVNLTNNSTSAYVPRVNMNIVQITSTSGTVKAANADNGGDGTSSSTSALYGYSNLLGADQVFHPGATTGNQTLKFTDPTAEMFNFSAMVTAYLPNSTGASGTGSSAATSPSGASSSSTTLGPLTVPKVTGLLRFSVNPATGLVAVQLK